MFWQISQQLRFLAMNQSVGQTETDWLTSSCPQPWKAHITQTLHSFPNFLSSLLSLSDTLTSPTPHTPAEVARNDTCPELPEISNGWKSTSHPELVQGTVVTYQCYPGYQVVGAELLMCQWDLTWSGDLPSCERGEYKTAVATTQLSTWKGKDGR